MRMEDTPYDAAMTRSKQELARQVVGANARIEALEADIADRESLLLAAGKRLAECDAAMVAAHTLLKRFEAALRKISKLYGNYGYAKDIARAALAPERDK